MAQELGIKRCWFHKTHYDIPKRRVEEIKKRCTVVPAKWIALLVHGQRWRHFRIFKTMLYAVEPDQS